MFGAFSVLILLLLKFVKQYLNDCKKVFRLYYVHLEKKSNKSHVSHVAA